MVNRLRRLMERSRWELRRTVVRLRRVLSGSPRPGALPVFIVGCGHSGTTLLLAMLSRHGTVHAIPYESSLARRSALDIDWFVNRFDREAARRGRTHWVEKTPSHVHSIGLLLRRFPAARVIVMRRDGRDVACSLRARTGDFQAGVLRWLEDNGAADQWLDDRRVLLARYEDLVEAPRASLEAVCEHVGIPFDERMLSHEEGDFRFLGRFEQHRSFARRMSGTRAAGSGASPRGDHRRFRSEQAARPVFDGRGRWQTDMTDDERAQFRRLAGDRLISYGYADDGSW